jgi:hypothetical protein
VNTNSVEREKGAKLSSDLSIFDELYGINFLGREGHWKWIWDNASLLPESSSFWRPGRPNSTTPNRDDCVMMVLGSNNNSSKGASARDFHWVDTSCLAPGQGQLSAAPICQQDKTAEPIASVAPPMAAATSRGASSSHCMAGWAAFEGRCYLAQARPMDWDSAEDHCASNYPGSHLASVESEAEHNFLAKQLMKGHVFWIGARLRSSDAYEWTDGSAWHYQRSSLFRSYSDSAADCVTGNEVDNWKNFNCSNSRRYVCKI